jgi:hypothetical protein
MASPILKGRDSPATVRRSQSIVGNLREEQRVLEDTWQNAEEAVESGERKKS